MTVLVTGAAGFIGFHLARALLENGREVVAIDNLNDYYEVTLKKARLDQLSSQSGFTFYQLDIADQSGMEKLVADHPEITGVLHMAAQAGVRYSLENPMAYAETNLQGQVQFLEVCRRLKKIWNILFLPVHRRSMAGERICLLASKTGPTNPYPSMRRPNEAVN